MRQTDARPLSVILLAGGLGTRLAHLHPGLPKPMIPLAGQPFLEWVLRYWAGQGIGHAVVSLGYQAAVAEAYLGQRPAGTMTIETVVEPQPLGTGGAIRFAAGAAAAQLSDPFFVANADSLLCADVRAALEPVEQGADGALLGVEVDDASRFGALVTGGGRRLLQFGEKQPGSGIINAGVYLFRRRLLERFPPHTPLSMEFEVFPALLAAGADLRVHVTPQAPFLDIGTPESLAVAEPFLKAHFA